MDLTGCGLEQDVVDPSGHLGHLFESQKVSERRIKELPSIEKLEVAGTTLQEAGAQASEIVCARWLDDAAKGTSKESAAVRSSVDATQVNAADRGEEVQAATPVTASRIVLSMAATKVNEKEQHYSLSAGWRNMTAW